MCFIFPPPTDIARYEISVSRIWLSYNVKACQKYHITLFLLVKNSMDIYDFIIFSHCGAYEWGKKGRFAPWFPTPLAEKPARPCPWVQCTPCGQVKAMRAFNSILLLQANYMSKKPCPFLCIL